MYAHIALQFVHAPQLVKLVKHKEQRHFEFAVCRLRLAAGKTAREQQNKHPNKRRYTVDVGVLNGKIERDRHVRLHKLVDIKLAVARVALDFRVLEYRQRVIDRGKHRAALVVGPRSLRYRRLYHGLMYRRVSVKALYHQVIDVLGVVRVRLVYLRQKPADSGEALVFPVGTTQTMQNNAGQ